MYVKNNPWCLELDVMLLKIQVERRIDIANFS